MKRHVSGFEFWKGESFQNSTRALGFFEKFFQSLDFPNPEAFLTALGDALGDTLQPAFCFEFFCNGHSSFFQFRIRSETTVDLPGVKLAIRSSLMFARLNR